MYTYQYHLRPFSYILTGVFETEQCNEEKTISSRSHFELSNAITIIFVQVVFYVPGRYTKFASKHELRAMWHHYVATKCCVGLIDPIRSQESFPTCPNSSHQ